LVFDVTPDGQRFLALLPQEDNQSAATGQAILVLHGLDEIRRLVSAAN